MRVEPCGSVSHAASARWQSVINLSGMAIQISKDERAISVSALTNQIDGSLRDFGPLLIQGELSQIKTAASGHCYATLKDAEASISLVMWRSTKARHGKLPPEGTQVMVRGSLSIFAPRGQYNLVATKIAEMGAGDLHRKFELLRARLMAEGLFNKQQPIPSLPRGLGIAAAPGSAALADMLSSIERRFPRMPITLALVKSKALAPQNQSQPQLSTSISVQMLN